MTNRIKTVQYPKLILVMCRNSEKIANLISDILNFCSYNTCIEDFSENTDYIIALSLTSCKCNGGYIADAALIDDTCENASELSDFRKIALPYEIAEDEFEEDSKLITYSADNYSADVACRSISLQGDSTVFDVVSGGVLSRARISSGEYSVDDVLSCSTVLIAAGVPLASVLGFFNK